MPPFHPLEALLGGALVGIASGSYMLLARRIAGNSGALKALLLGPRDDKVGFLAGLAMAGATMSVFLPKAFDPSPPLSIALCISGLLMGAGAALANGCTSGHGLCGLSRFSLRSLAAVPTFMATGILASTITGAAETGSYRFGSFAPMVAPDPDVISVVIGTIAVLGLTALPLFLMRRSETRDVLVGLWSGFCFGTGLTVGGMVRPSVVRAALSPNQIDLTLWVLFCTALATTFAMYRVAEKLAAIREAVASPGGVIDRKLLCGAALFGIGWGSSGFCPGPLIVSIGALPAGSGIYFFLLSTIAGMLAADRLATNSKPA